MLIPLVSDDCLLVVTEGSLMHNELAGRGWRIPLWWYRSPICLPALLTRVGACSEAIAWAVDNDCWTEAWDKCPVWMWQLWLICRVWPESPSMYNMRKELLYLKLLRAAGLTVSEYINCIGACYSAYCWAMDFGHDFKAAWDAVRAKRDRRVPILTWGTWLSDTLQAYGINDPSDWEEVKLYVPNGPATRERDTNL